MKNKVVAIVDAYSAANQLAAAFREKGMSCIHVQTYPKIASLYAPSFKAEDFTANVIHHGNLDETASALRRLSVDYVVTGMEGGVNLADALSEKLGVVSNGTELSAARRNKFLMAEAISRHGLRITPQIASSDLSEILTWIETNSIGAVVLKPPSSAGTDRVRLCRTRAEIESAFDEIKDKPNFLGAVDDKVLVQKLISGTEYVVNMVSAGGKRRLVDIWRYVKMEANGSSFVYDCDDILPPTGDIQDRLVDYVSKVLDALKIDHGACHAEVFYTSDGPVLTEIGARVDGAANHALLEECAGRNPFSMTVDAYAFPERLLEMSNQYSLKKHARNVCLVSYVEGVLKEIRHLDEIRSLKSFQGIQLRVDVGRKIAPTIDVLTLPALIRLVHESAAVIEEDYRRIRELEASGILIV